jgi:hypothetical protein
VEPLMIPDAIWHATAASTVVCLISDLVVFGIQQRQRERLGVMVENLGLVWRILLSILFNAVFTFLFAYVYHAVALGSGRAYFVGGLVWLSVVIPTLMTSRHLNENQRSVLTTRMLGWFIKSVIASVAVDTFIG